MNEEGRHARSTRLLFNIITGISILQNRIYYTHDVFLLSTCMCRSNGIQLEQVGQFSYSILLVMCIVCSIAPMQQIMISEEVNE